MVRTRILATVGQLKTAEEFINDTFVCMYGDSIFDFNLRDMIKRHRTKRSFLTKGKIRHDNLGLYYFNRASDSSTHIEKISVDKTGEAEQTLFDDSLNTPVEEFSAGIQQTVQPKETRLVLLL